MGGGRWEEGWEAARRLSLNSGHDHHRWILRILKDAARVQFRDRHAAEGQRSSICCKLSQKDTDVSLNLGLRAVCRLIGVVSLITGCGH